MAEPEYSTFANREEAIPVLRIPLAEHASHTIGDNDDGRISAREVLKAQKERIKGKIEDANREVRSGGLQERLLNSFMAHMIPSDNTPDNDSSSDFKDRRSSAYVERPSFSLPTMSTNFRRFNSRIGIVFVFQNRLIRLFGWTTPSHTLSFLAVYTLLCLQPALIPSVPLALAFFYIMIPSFLARHPPPSDPNENTLQNSHNASSVAELESAWSSYAIPVHATAPPKRVKPAPEMSKDFFRNMRDLQNSMEDFSRIHDTAIATISPYTDFSDEKTSSSVFLAICVSLSAATIAAHLVPWRMLALLAGWSVTGMGHPRAQEYLVQLQNSKTFQDMQAVMISWMRDWVESDIVLDEPAEVREVEVFELQRRLNRASGVSGLSGDHLYHSRTASDASSNSNAHVLTGYDGDDENWEPWLFTPAPHDPLSPQRLSGAWPAGSQFFEEVGAPSGWLWRDKKWTLDLLSEAWVEERCVTGVEVEREGGRWVYDISYPDSSMGQSSKAKEPTPGPNIAKSWEEGTGRGSKGEWRRRRWVRLVERKRQKVSDPEEDSVSSEK